MILYQCTLFISYLIFPRTYSSFVYSFAYLPSLPSQLGTYIPWWQELYLFYSQLVACRRNVNRGAWRAGLHRVTRSQTQVKQLSIHACRRNMNSYLLDTWMILPEILNPRKQQETLLPLLPSFSQLRSWWMEFHSDGTNEEVLMKRFLPEAWLGLRQPGWRLLWYSSGWDSVPPVQGAWVRSLIRELGPTCCN